MSNIFNKLKGFIINDSLLRNATSILHNCKNQSENKLWYKRGLVTDDFRSRHSIFMTHIWLVNRRILLEGKEGLKLQECLFDEFWDDTSSRIRAAGINELSVNKRLSEVQSYSLQCCFEFDDVINNEKNETDTVILDKLGNILWKSVYNQREDIKSVHVLEFAKAMSISTHVSVSMNGRYVHSEYKSLQQIPKTAIFEGKFQWNDVPWGDPTQHKHTHGRDKNKEVQTPPQNEWKKALATDGRIYYWNIHTRKSQWDKPANYIE